MAFMHGDFARARQLAEATLQAGMSFDDATEGPYGVQMYMISRETGGLEVARRHLTGRETFAGRWVPGMLALYTELDITEGIRRALRQLLSRDLAAHAAEAQWPLELAFMVEAALALADRDAAAVLEPFMAAYAGKNLVGGQFVAVFGSADRYLGRLVALRGDAEAAARHYTGAEQMDRRMGAPVHLAETLGHHAALLRVADPIRAAELARQARDLAEPSGHQRVLAMLEPVGPATAPDSLTDREVEVLRLIAAGLSNREIADRLYISANTAANHVRSILLKTGASNRTRAARYAAERDLL
jgi:DNA-binding CsgD family transcriptional regulator